MITVQEMIDHLKTFPPDAPFGIGCSGPGTHDTFTYVECTYGVVKEED